MTLGNFKDWLEGYLCAVGCSLTSEQEQTIMHKLLEVQIHSKHRERAYEYLVKPLITTNTYNTVN